MSVKDENFPRAWRKEGVPNQNTAKQNREKTTTEESQKDKHATIFWGAFPQRKVLARPDSEMCLRMGERSLRKGRGKVGALNQLAMGQNLWLHFGVDEHPCTTYFDVHQGYRVLTHSQLEKQQAKALGNVETWRRHRRTGRSTNEMYLIPNGCSISQVT